MFYFPAVFSGREGTGLHSGVSSISLLCLLSSFPLAFCLLFFIFYYYYSMLCYIVLIEIDKTVSKLKFCGRSLSLGCVQLEWGALGSNTLSVDCVDVLAGDFKYKNNQWSKAYVCLWQGMLRSSRHQILLWGFAAFIMP